MKFDPRHLEMLAAIVEAGGLTEGAAMLGKSQPSVSRSIAFLERRIGQRLFEPKRRPLRPTEIGLLLAQEGKRILEAGRAASALADGVARGVAGAVRVAGTPIFMDGVISGVIADFQGRHPNVRIDQSYAYAEEAMEKIAQDLLDLAILPLRPGTLSDEFAFCQILPGRNVIACRTDHPLAGRATLKSTDVVRYPWIAPPANSPLFHDLRAFLDRIDQREMKIGFTGGSLTAVLNVLSGSDSLTVLPFSVVFMLQRRNRIAALPVEIGDPNRHLGILTRRSAKPPMTARRFTEFTMSRFKEIEREIAAAGA
ncbi:MAG: LysR family transcriptional regulator [Alphaproteobacteria bacterium]|nr:LysR family transcriptional regulator [Alphaproteobacteria bacterium]